MWACITQGKIWYMEVRESKVSVGVSPVDIMGFLIMGCLEGGYAFFVGELT